ncbi:hypothetical protein M407DRAFT_5812 [Tulasnella calospora MUT 4182]|uniref:Uncharacterized protein n=1 Tax=Tulasnella calospora MUT 4182 TaxID=1051891 RepID=A0A0C3M8S9_9AGAM|nr:hypothetical protein M407DRAFT_5812 [Tulasnella calospora MUT 4182]
MKNFRRLPEGNPDHCQSPFVNTPTSPWTQSHASCSVWMAFTSRAGSIVSPTGGISNSPGMNIADETHYKRHLRTIGTVRNIQVHFLSSGARTVLEHVRAGTGLGLLADALERVSSISLASLVEFGNRSMWGPRAMAARLPPQHNP